jgi:hypothetical protein
MLSDCDSQLDADKESNGQPSTWNSVYGQMRCPGPPCDLGLHCWIEPSGKKHYNLKAHHLRALVEHVDDGKPLRNHDDVPEKIREQLVAEEQQQLQRRPKTMANMPTSFPPINITNVLPSSQPPSTASSVGSSDPPASHFSSITPLDILGVRDAAVRSYTEWQQSNVIDEDQKKDYKRACDITLRDGLDLELISEKSIQVEKLIREKLKEEAAHRFVYDIPRWAKRQKQCHNAELD